MSEVLAAGIVSSYIKHKKFGEIIGEDGVKYGFHLSQGRRFTLVKGKIEFNDCPTSRDPKPDENVRYLLNGALAAKSGPKVETWGFESDYETAAEILGRTEAEILSIVFKLRRDAFLERLRVNPRFRLCEQEILDGRVKSEPVAVRFIGTKPEFEAAKSSLELATFDDENVYGYLDRSDGTKSRQWFERESAIRWGFCSNPEKENLPPKQVLSFDRARDWLSISKVYVNQKTRDDSDQTWLNDWGPEVVACGFRRGKQIVVEFPENAWRAFTRFEGNLASDLFGLCFSAAPLTVKDERRTREREDLKKR
jgi:hypothetical protein